MTSPESSLPRDRYALLASGANFSCQVLQALRRKHYQPTLLVLPEYPPAKSMSNPDTEIVAASPRRPFLELGQDIVIGYAPADQQAECASLIQQAAIDYILVACWPYLIGEALITSPTKAALNLHPSLLPDFRGPNPIEQQLARGMSRFGVTLHLLNQQFDRGDIVAQAELIDIDENADLEYLEHRNAVQGVELFLEAIKSHDEGWKPIQQTA